MSAVHPHNLVWWKPIFQARTKVRPSETCVKKYFLLKVLSPCRGSLIMQWTPSTVSKKVGTPAWSVNQCGGKNSVHEQIAGNLCEKVTMMKMTNTAKPPWQSTTQSTTPPTYLPVEQRLRPLNDRPQPTPDCSNALFQPSGQLFLCWIAMEKVKAPQEMHWQHFWRLGLNGSQVFPKQHTDCRGGSIVCWKLLLLLVLAHPIDVIPGHPHHEEPDEKEADFGGHCFWFLCFVDVGLNGFVVLATPQQRFDGTGFDELFCYE